MLSPQGLASSPSFPFPGIGDLIAGRYRVERKIGSGGMGIVVCAIDEQMGVRVAIKLLRPEEPEPPAAYRRADESGVVDRSSKHEQLSTRLIREASAASRLSSSHVTRVLDVGRLEGGDPYVVMEMLEGIDLNRHAKGRGPLPIVEAVGYVLQACEAIHEAHELGIVHRDLKPANLFLTTRADGTPFVKVLDFGISKVLGADDNQLTQTTDMLGSPLYMAPEQIRNARDVDGRADVWSLGAILYRLIAGRAAFEAQGSAATLAAIISDPPHPLRAIRPDVPPDLEAVVLRCLEKDRARRTQTVRELAIALQRFAVPQTGSFFPLSAAMLPPPNLSAGAHANVSAANVSAANVGAANVSAGAHTTAGAAATGSVAPNAVTVAAPARRSYAVVAILAVLAASSVGGGIAAWKLFGSSPVPASSAAEVTAAPSPSPTAPPAPVVSAAPSAEPSAAPDAPSTAATATPSAVVATPTAAPTSTASASVKAPPRVPSPVQGKPSDDPLGDRY